MVFHCLPLYLRQSIFTNTCNFQLVYFQLFSDAKRAAHIAYNGARRKEKYIIIIEILLLLNKSLKSFTSCDRATVE